jgi:dihydroorotate dehydrogenase electron transfer subunit
MERLSTTARVRETTVSSRRECAPGIFIISLSAPDLGGVTRPGQYVMVVPPCGERAATALGVYDADDDGISLLFFVTGSRTAELASLRAGDRLDVLGPLGNGFDLSGDPRDVGIVAGGVGIASVLLPAVALRRAGARVRLYYGARSVAHLVEAGRFADEGCELLLATDDGSAGHRGFVTDLIARDDAPALLLACGPSPMLRAVERLASERGIRAQLSLEETFACGVGGCWGCIVPVARESAQAPNFPPASAGGSDVVNARICKEGPVFWAHELRW